MNRDDKSKYLLYIEPRKSEKLSEPVNDNLTEAISLAISKAKSGTANYSSLDDMGEGTYSFEGGSGYRGIHVTECGEASSNKDYLLENGMIVNSLAPFYTKWYRNSIKENDMNKLKELAKFYNL